MVGFDLLTLYRGEGARASALARLRQLEQLAVGEGLPVADFVLHSPTGRPLAGAGDGRAGDGRGRPGHAVDLLRHHRAPRYRGRAAALRGPAVASVRDQPGLHHADRDGERPLRDGQPRVHARHRLRGWRGGRAHRRRDRHLARRRPIASAWWPRCASAGSVERRGADDRHQGGRAGVAAACRRRASRWPARTTWWSTRTTSPSPNARASSMQRSCRTPRSASPSCATGRFQQVNPSWERMFGCDAGAARRRAR